MEKLIINEYIYYELNFGDGMVVGSLSNVQEYFSFPQY